MTTPVERLAELVIGVVESVSPDEIRVQLELDAPQATAFNTGTPSAFPRINGYVLIPNEAGATVAYISWIGIERSPYPKRSGLKDFGLIDLPFPLRKMTVAPVGTLTTVRDYVSKASTFELARGVTAFPSVGDQVLMPTAAQIEAIVGGNDSERRVYIGSSPMAANARIMVDPDKLFGRHLAILGNTGSGKSCTVAGLIRWSIEAAENALKISARTSGEAITPPNMRFIILDPNGEYAKAFEDMPGKVRVFKPGDPCSPFVLPAWFWNSHEWSSITEAKPGAQRPILMQALRSLRAGRLIQEPLHVSIIRQARMFKSRVITYMSDGSGVSFTRYPELGNCLDMFSHIHAVMTDYGSKIAESDPAYGPVNRLAAEAKQFYDRHQEWSDKAQRYFGRSTNVVELQNFLPMFSAIEASLPM